MLSAFDAVKRNSECGLGPIEPAGIGSDNAQRRSGANSEHAIVEVMSQLLSTLLGSTGSE